MNVDALGFVDSTVSWTSIFPGTTGQYNSYLSCTTGCASPNFNPDDFAPEYIHYLVCGNPIADECGYNMNYCDTVVIRTMERLEASVLPNPAMLCSSGGSITLLGSASGGDGNYTYTWKDNSGSILANGSNYTISSAGPYTLEVMDGLFGPTCPSALVNVPVVMLPPAVVNAGPDQNLCGSATSVTLSGSVTNASSGIWSGGGGTYSPANTSLNVTYYPTAAEIESGTVTLVLTSSGAQGCPNQSDSITINFAPILNVTLLNDTVLCYGQTITFGPTVTGGSGAYTYNWNNGATTATINGGAGNYCVTVTDSAGCLSTKCATISTPAPLTVTLTKSDATVVAGTDGSATANPSGGTQPYTYSWSTGDSTQTISNLSSGIYTVTVTDANGCTTTSSIAITEPQCTGFNVTIVANNPGCNGSDNGSVTAIVSGGVTPFAFNWSTGDVTQSVINLGPGNYTVVVTDVNLCQSSATVTLIEPPVLSAIDSVTNVTIVGGSDGTATVSASGGTPGYLYSWSNGGSTATISNLTYGTYYYTITDQNGCTISDSVFVDRPYCMNRSVSITSDDVNCINGSDGTATATMNFGISPFTYQWSNGQLTQTSTGLSAGVYSVIVTDSVNCVANATITITEPTELEIAITVDDVNCNGNFDGNINLTVGGGTFPYTYSWSNGVSAQDPVNLFAGTYNVLVTDANGCTISGSAVVNEPQPLTYSYTKTDVTCNGLTNGSIDVTVSGGTQPYNYSWTNGATTQDLTGLGSSSYTVYISDANNCQVVSYPSILVDQPAVLIATGSSVACPTPGATTTNVTLLIFGGSAPYQISYDNGNTYYAPGVYSATLPIDSLYNIVVKDSNNCISPATYSVTVPPAVEITNVTFNPCVTPGASTVTLTSATTGGNGPYQISWDGGTTFGSAGNYSTNLPFNTSYTVVAMDANGCASVPLVINVPDSLHLSATAATFAGNYNISCAGMSDGSITTLTSGGTTAYTWQWSGPNGFSSSSASIASLGAGTYNLILTDANQCTKSLTVTITEPATLTSSLSAATVNGGYNISCSGLSDGSITSSNNGGTAPYSFAWTGPNNYSANTSSISNLEAGSYTLVVTDQNGCTATNTITLTEPAVLTASVSGSAFNGFGVSCNGSSDGSLTSTVSGGTAAYNFVWTGPGNFSAATQNISNIAAGNYTLTVTDQNGCKYSTSYEITQPQPIFSSFTAGTYNGGYNISCYGATDGSITSTINGGVNPFQFSWSGPNGFASSQQDLSSIGAGTYLVTYTDDNGCSASASVTITEPAALTSNASTSSYNGFGISCYNEKDGNILIDVLGGTSPFVVEWNGPNGFTSSSEDLNGVGAGNYSAVITDQNNCSVSVNAVLTEPDAIVLSAVTVNETCEADNGTVDLSSDGGVFPYSYNWSNGTNQQDLNGLTSGIYSVTVTDQNGCTAVYNATVEATSPMTVDATVQNDSCYGGTNGFIHLAVTNGQTPYQYAWSNNSSTEDLDNLAAGEYSVTITDANGCRLTQTYSVTQPDKLILTAVKSVYPTGYNISEFEGTDGYINITAAGGNQPYQYEWSTGATEPSISNLAAGTYTVTCNAGGCLSSLSIELLDPLDLKMPSAFSPNGDGANDLFVVKGLDAYPTNKIVIINRWGNEVFSQMNYQNTWNGTSNGGKELPDGTYFVILEIQGANLVLKGYVDMRR